MSTPTEIIIATRPELEQVKVAVLGPPPAPNAPAPPTVQELAALIAQQASIINAQSSVIQQQQASINAFPQMLTDGLASYNTSVIVPLTATVATKAAASTVTALAGTVAQQATDIAARATTASVTTLAGTVAQQATDIAAKATTTALATETGRINTLLTTTVPGLQTDIGNRLSKAGDTSTGQQNGMDGVTDASFITQRQIAQGVKRPVPLAQSVTTANTALVPTLNDPLQKNRQALVIQVKLYMKTAPAAGLGATVKVGTTPGGSDVLNKAFLLAALPGLNTLLDLPQSALTILPANTTLYATATGGTWMVLVDTLFLN